MKMSEAERRAFERFMMNKASERGMLESAKIEGLEAGERIGHEKGLKEGMDQARLEMARAMLAKGEAFEKIKLYAQLSEQEILKLQSPT